MIDYTWFKPRKGGQNTLVFILTFLLFPLLGLMLIIVSKGDTDMLVGGLFLLLGGGAAVIYLALRSVASGFNYGLGEKDLFLKRGKEKRHIPMEDLKGVAVLEGDELKHFLRTLSKPITEAQLQMDLRQWWKNSKVYGEITRWVSVAITESETRSGGPMNISGYTINLEGPTVFLKLKNREILLITPENPKNLIDQLQAGGVEKILPGESLSLIPVLPQLGNAPDTNRNLKNIRRFSLVSLAVITAAFLLWFILSAPGSRPGPHAEQETPPQTKEINSNEETGPINVAGFWEDDSLFYLILRVDESLSNARLEPGEIALPETGRLAAQAMDEEYQGREGHSESRIDEIELFLKFNALIRFQDSTFNDSGEEFFIYSVIEDNYKSIIEDFYK